jgi:hypothetical protein
MTDADAETDFKILSLANSDAEFTAPDYNGA